MTRPNVHATLGVRYLDEGPVIETRARPIATGSPIPEGKLLVVRTPILPPGASEAQTRARVETLWLEDEGAPFEEPCWVERLEAETPYHLIALGAGASVAGSLQQQRRDRTHATFI